MKKLFFICVLLFTSCLAAQDNYPFDTVLQQQRFQTLTTEFRCLVCQNQNLAESNAALASDLRGQIYQKVLHGESNQQIIDYLVTRYGNTILYRPPLNAYTLGLWFGPFLVLIMGLCYLFFYLSKKR